MAKASHLHESHNVDELYYTPSDCLTMNSPVLMPPDPGSKYAVTAEREGEAVSPEGAQVSAEDDDLGLYEDPEEDSNTVYDPLDAFAQLALDQNTPPGTREDDLSPPLLSPHPPPPSLSPLGCQSISVQDEDDLPYVRLAKLPAIPLRHPEREIYITESAPKSQGV